VLDEMADTINHPVIKLVAELPPLAQHVKDDGQNG
jgi:hypothetical protein